MSKNREHCEVDTDDPVHGCVGIPKRLMLLSLSGGKGRHQATCMALLRRGLRWGQVRVEGSSATSPKGCAYRLTASGMDSSDVRPGRRDAPEDTPVRMLTLISFGLTPI